MSPLTHKLLEQLQHPANHAENAALTEALRLWRFAGCPDLPPKDGSFGEWLARTRKARGATLRSMSAALNVQLSRLCRVENDHCGLYASEWIGLCVELNLTPEERATGESLLLAGRL